MRSSAIGFVLSVVAGFPAVAQSSRGAPVPTQTNGQTVPRQSATSNVAPIRLEDQWTTALVRRDASERQG